MNHYKITKNQWRYNESMKNIVLQTIKQRSCDFGFRKAFLMADAILPSAVKQLETRLIIHFPVIYFVKNFERRPRVLPLELLKMKS